MMKPRSSYSKTAFILLFSVFLVAAVTKAKSSLPDVTLEQAKEMNADNTVIFLFRHGERCDRSDMPCYSDKSGITITGTEKAQQEGIKFATIFSEYDIYSSNAVRTIQTAKFFSGKEPVVMDSLSDCNNDLYKTLESIARESHKRNIVIMTGFAPIFPDTCYHLTHYWPAAADIPVASDNPVHYAGAIRYNARTPLQGSLLPLTRLV